MFENLVNLIKEYDKIIIHRHKNPDGDALGSQFGLYHIIKDSYPEKQVYMVGDMTPRYAFMATREMDNLTDEDFRGALCIILDSGAPALVSDDRYTLADKVARIDHHLFVEKFADEEVIDTSFESCCGEIAALAMESGLTLSADGAKALYTGMVTDSGRVRYDSTGAKTHRLASFLMEREFDTNDIYRNLYSDDLANIQLRASFTLKIKTTPYRTAYIYTTLDELKASGADVFTISRGMVGTMSEIKGIDSWVNFTETEDGVLCEIRSNKYNINPIAVKYGGGGHQKASGATLKDREEAMRLLDDLNALTEEN